VALALPEGGKLVACDLSEEYTASAWRTWREAGVEGKIDPRLASFGWWHVLFPLSQKPTGFRHRGRRRRVKGRATRLWGDRGTI
jgi:hypothetical protein